MSIRVQAGTSGLGYLNPFNYEAGLSERASDYFGQGRTSNLGSNLFGNQTQTTQVPAGISSSGQTQFAPSGGSGAYGITQGNKANPAISGGSVKGASTSNTGGGSTQTQQVNQNQPQQPSQPSYADQLYSSLGSAYNNLSGQLDPMYQNRKQGIEDLYGAGLKDISLQEQAGLDTLGNQRTGVQTNQVRNLKDLANAITQSFGSFSNQLGNMGAGDSSAARVMMPYALSRVEAGQRGAINRTTADKIGEIDARESQLKNTVLQERNKLDQAKMGEMASLGEWFDNAKMQISQMKLSDAKAAGEQAMQFAMQKIQGIEDNFNARKNALDSWAISNSKDLASLKSNLGAMTDPSLLGQLPQFAGLNINQSTGQSTGGYQAPTGFGYGSPEEIFKKLGLA